MNKTLTVTLLAALAITMPIGPAFAASPRAALRQRVVQHKKAKRAAKLRAKREEFHKAEAILFDKAFSAWTKTNPQVAQIYKEQRRKRGVPRQYLHRGVGAGLVGFGGLGMLGMLLTDPVLAGGPMLAALVGYDMAPSRRDIAKNRLAAKVDTITLAKKQGLEAPKSTKPVYVRQLRIAERRARNKVRTLEKKHQSAKSELERLSSQLDEAKR